MPLGIRDSKRWEWYVYSKNGQNIACIPTDLFLHDVAHAEANTRLIAAAPDLLAACKWLRDRLQHRCVWHLARENHADQLAIAKAASAIAVAEGTADSRTANQESPTITATVCPECGDETETCPCEEPFEVREPNGEVFARYWKLAEAVAAASAEEHRRGVDVGEVLEVHINPAAIFHNQIPVATHHAK